MPKRFTATEKWRKGFLKGLGTVHKLLWLYILDECDHAGIWDVELDVATIRIGEDVTGCKAGDFGGKVLEIDEGRKWFVPDFITYQYGDLNDKVKAHKSAINRLKNQIPNEILPSIIKPFAKGLGRVKDKEEDKDKDKEGVQGEVSSEEDRSGLVRALEAFPAIQARGFGLGQLVEFLKGKNGESATYLAALAEACGDDKVVSPASVVAGRVSAGRVARSTVKKARRALEGPKEQERRFTAVGECQDCGLEWSGSVKEGARSVVCPRPTCKSTISIQQMEGVGYER